MGKLICEICSVELNLNWRHAASRIQFIEQNLRALFTISCDEIDGFAWYSAASMVQALDSDCFAVLLGALCAFKCN
jgi:hypothetical protein